MSTIKDNLLLIRYEKFVSVRDLDYIFGMEEPVNIEGPKQKKPKIDMLDKNKDNIFTLRKERVHETRKERETNQEKKTDSFLTYSPRRIKTMTRGKEKEKEKEKEKIGRASCRERV